MKSITLVSGGMDSVTLMYQLHSQEAEQLILSFYYGQKHTKELDGAAALSKGLGLDQLIIDIDDYGLAIKGCALTDYRKDVPHGHYEAETMRDTVVPGRNAVMLSIAWGLAASCGADLVSCAVHSGDHYIYPDCRPEFISALSGALALGTKGHAKDTLKINTPFIKMTKGDICSLGASLDVPLQRTWTCYEGGSVHCGECGSCIERQEAFIIAGVDDPTTYLVKHDASHISELKRISSHAGI